MTPLEHGRLVGQASRPVQGGFPTRRWSFYIFSGGGTADELFFRDFDLELFQEFGVFGHFLA
jgi:hypothetical protein